MAPFLQGMPGRACILPSQRVPAIIQGHEGTGSRLATTTADTLPLFYNGGTVQVVGFLQIFHEEGQILLCLFLCLLLTHSA